MIRFNEYQTTKINFNINKNFSTDANQIEVTPIFKRNVKHYKNDYFIIEITVIINEIEKPMPFTCEVILEGLFHLNNSLEKLEKNFMLDNATAILFPYLRTTVATVTQLSGLPVYNLPVINITEYFRVKEKEV